jgi:hypothetical protein
MKATIKEIEKCIYRWIEVKEDYDWSGPCIKFTNLEEVAKKVKEMIEEKELL